MNKYYTFVTFTGEISGVQQNPENPSFRLKLLSGDVLEIYAAANTNYEVIKNLDGLDRDRVESPKRNPGELDWNYNLRKYIRDGLMVCVQGVQSINGNAQRIDARRVILMHSTPGHYAWEDTHWWISQVTNTCDEWLDALFSEKREIEVDDFAKNYRTNLNILGGRTDNNIQECATLSRFLYGLSSTYLMTGQNRFYTAARAAANYLCDTFRSPSHDDRYCFWNFGHRMVGNISADVIASQNPDDLGTYALYEQIYALSGLAQYYRISQDRRIGDVIEKTINSFQDFYHDTKREGDQSFTGKGGYFSHLDPVTMRPDAEVLKQNRMKKNWNSIGDHIPAYLINLLLTIDPLPNEAAHWVRLRALCWSILDECVDNILEYFPRGDSDYVQERFLADWTPDLTWGWQQNRAVVGHNLKIAWNLTRCGHYYNYRKSILQTEGYHADAVQYGDRAVRCYDMAKTIGRKMAKVGLDLARGGIFDSVERVPKNGMPTEFSWSCTKDFWQQEQAILAYLILNGIDQEKDFLTYARYCAAFWNLFFLDRDNGHIRFRTGANGEPIVEGNYAQQGGHAIAGYHSFELSYLAHFYTRCYVEKEAGADDAFVLNFHPVPGNGPRRLNVMPDFVMPDEVEIAGVKVNGEEISGLNQNGFMIDLANVPPDGKITVTFMPKRRLETKG